MRVIALLLEVGVAVTNDYAATEAERNLRAKRPTWLEPFGRLCARMEFVTSTAYPLPVELPHKDVPILCSAIQAGCSLLVTGDRRDFGHLYETSVGGVVVVPLQGLAERLFAV